MTTTVTEGPDGPTLAWTIDHAACLAWGHTHWGKTILFTDHADWSTAQIITAYRDAWHVAQTFRDLKQAPWLRWQPPFHWTDDTMRVHGFLCILAVTLAHLLRRHYAQAGLPLSLPELLQDLTAMQQVLLVYPSGSGIPDRLTLTDLTPRQQQLLDLLDIPVPDVTAR